MEFYNTRMGQEFYSGTMPRAVKALEEIAKITPALDRIADALEKIVENQTDKPAAILSDNDDEIIDDLTPLDENDKIENDEGAMAPLPSEDESENKTNPITFEDMLDMTKERTKQKEKPCPQRDVPVLERDIDTSATWDVCPYYKKGRCSGTREIETCNCDGHKIRCSFYPKERVKAKAEYEKKVRTAEAMMMCGEISFSEMLDMLRKINF